MNNILNNKYEEELHISMEGLILCIYENDKKYLKKYYTDIQLLLSKYNNKDNEKFIIKALKLVKMPVYEDPKGYLRAYNKAKEYLKQILNYDKEVKNISQYNNVKNNKNTVLTICNKFHYTTKYFTINTDLQTNIKKLVIHDLNNYGNLILNFTMIHPYTDLWNSKENDILIAKDSYNNIYVFKFNKNSYILQDAYNFNNSRLMLENYNYKHIANNIIIGNKRFSIVL